MVLVPTDPIRTAPDFLKLFDNRHAYRFDTSQIQHDEALEVAASLVDWVTDLNDVWDDCSMSQRLEYARNFVEQCVRLEALGYLCHLGHHRQVLREKGRADLVFVVGLLSILPKESGKGRRYGLVELEGRWETVPEDRPPVKLQRDRHEPVIWRTVPHAIDRPAGIKPKVRRRAETP
jgi:hypothetical protein